MSNIRINNITNKTGNTGPVVAGVSTVSSSTFMIIPSGNVEIRGGGSGRAIFCGGYTPSIVNTIDMLTIQSTGDSQDFGDLSVAHSEMGGISNGHGGLG